MATHPPSTAQSSAPTTSTFLSAYEPLDVIGNGSFGIIRKVRRKADGLVFARKELDFERMSERDRKQIVAEVNILKDLNHPHIVRYHDRFVDRDAGILYILMEFCGGGDLSTVIKQASRAGRPIAEDVIWAYFYQILQALCHCHHPNSHGRSASGGGSPVEVQGLGSAAQGRRAQVLHRDLKPDNVFLDENNTVKLGDFGLSKALAQASFANTYVGTPYYMSPELMQEKAYDSKSDIWSLGCLIYELCALKPPFHEAKTHSELSIFIRNGRIPPLPRGYSQALASVIKSMLNLNPAMRPSAVQLLQHERLELVSRVAEAEKMLSTVKTHRATIAAKEREVLAREQSVLESQQRLSAVVEQKDGEIAALQRLVAELQTRSQSSHLDNHRSHQSQNQVCYTQAEVESAIKHAVTVREEELRTLVMQREAEVAQAIAQREDEIMDAVRKREAEVDAACRAREDAVRREAEAWMAELETRRAAVEERREELERKEQALAEEEASLNDREEQLKKREEAVKSTSKGPSAGKKDKSPLEEVKNVLEPAARMAQAPSLQYQRRARSNTHSNTNAATHNPESQATPRPTVHPPHRPIETPVARNTAPSDIMFSAMKGVVLTATGETLATPSPAELVTLFKKSPKVGLNFGRIFDFGPGNKLAKIELPLGDTDEGDSPPPSPSVRHKRERDSGTCGTEENVADDDGDESSSACNSTGAAGTQHQQPQARQLQRAHSVQSIQSQEHLAAPPPTRIRRPSLRNGKSTNHSNASSATRSSRSVHSKSRSSSTLPPSCSEPTGLCNTGATSTMAGTSSHPHFQQPKPLPHPHLRPSTSASNLRSAASGSSGSGLGPAWAAGAGSSATVSFPVLPIPVPSSYPSPEYDFADEENLPSPFLKRVEKKTSLSKGKMTGPIPSVGPSLSQAVESSSGSVPGSGPATSSSSATTSTSATSNTRTKRRGSSGLLLRAVAAANSAGRRNGVGAAVPESDVDSVGTASPTYGVQHDDGGSMSSGSGGSTSTTENARPSLASARKASEEARKALLRP